MNLYPRQFVASIIIGTCLLILIIRLIQKSKLDITYCWLWLFIGISTILVVVKYDWLVRISRVIGAVEITTTLFLFAIIIILLMCLQFSLVISSHRRQIKKMIQEIAILKAEVNNSSNDTINMDRKNNYQ